MQRQGYGNSVSVDVEDDDDGILFYNRKIHVSYLKFMMRSRESNCKKVYRREALPPGRKPSFDLSFQIESMRAPALVVGGSK